MTCTITSLIAYQDCVAAKLCYKIWQKWQGIEVDNHSTEMWWRIMVENMLKNLGRKIQDVWQRFEKYGETTSSWNFTYESLLKNVAFSTRGLNPIPPVQHVGILTTRPTIYAAAFGVPLWWSKAMWCTRTG